jgi:hypothetical protein
VQILGSELCRKINKGENEARQPKKRWGRDRNADEGFVIFVKIQQILLDALLHIFILLLLKKIDI